MQSLQMRWPVAAHIGLSIDRDGERAERVALRLRPGASRRSSPRAGSRRAGRRTALFLNAPVFSLRPGRAAVLALVVAPDAVVGLVERAGEIGAGIGEREALASAAMRGRQLRACATPSTTSVSTGTRCCGSSLCGSLNSTPPLWARCGLPACASPRRRSGRRDRAPRRARPRPSSRRRRASAKRSSLSSPPSRRSSSRAQRRPVERRGLLGGCISWRRGAARTAA